MGPRAAILPLALAAFLGCVTLRAAPPPTIATNPALTFFSTLSEEPFARLQAESIGPRYTRHGPFRVPAPGLEIETPVLTLLDQPCTPDDWARVLRDLAEWRRLPGAAQFLLTLPDGRVLSFLRPPALGDSHLSGLVRALAPSGSPPEPALLLRIAHDGDTRLRIDLRPLPRPVTRAADPALGGTPPPASESANGAPAAPAPAEVPDPAATPSFTQPATP